MIGISVKDFSIAFGNNTILENISFDVQEGEIFTILGSSGCGKSTILRCIASLEENFKGNIFLNNKDIKTSSSNKDIGYIFQDYALFPHLNVQENIQFALDHLNKQQKQAKLDKLLKQFDLINHRHKQIHELSGGQQQRVSIARVIAYEPKVILLDEPFSNLDSILRHKTKDWLKSIIKEFGLSAILVTHDQKEALSMSDKIAIINNKTIVQCDTPEILYTKPNSYFVAKFLGDTNILPNELASFFDIQIEHEQEMIIRVNKTNITNKKNSIPLQIINISYFGDYYEVEAVFNGFKDYKLSLRLSDCKDLDINSCVYLDICKSNILQV